MEQFVKKFNNLVKKTIFKVQNKTNNNFKINSFNKILLTFISLLFVYLFYLLTPLLYSKTWVQTNIESKLLNEFKINLSTSGEISYHILPAPHFLIKNSKIIIDDTKIQKAIAEIKYLKVFLIQGNFFNKEKLNIKKVVIREANFSLLRSDFNLLKKFKNKNFLNKKIKITYSNIFFKDNLGEVISIIKIDKALLFFDDEKLLNIFNLRGEVFNIPFTFNFNNSNDHTKFEAINLNFKSLRLNILNELGIKKNNSIVGKNIVSFLNNEINTEYYIEEKLIIFKSSSSKIKNSQIEYRGKISINPFDLDLKINLDNYKISKLFNIHPILIEFIKSKLLLNKNISINTSVDINSNLKNEIFQNAKINFHIINGKVDFNGTKFINDKIGSLELSNSNLFFKNDNLLFNSDILINIENSDNLFSFLNTSKLLRKDLKNILINLDYNFLTNQIKLNNIKIDNNETNDELRTIAEDFNNNNRINLNNSRQLINELLKAAYKG
jgi:hypothetical protein